MKIMITAFLLTIGALTSLVLAQSNDSNISRSPTLAVSLVRLLLEPEVYADRKVSVVGFMSGAHLYPTRDQAQYRDVMSSLRIIDESESAEIYQSACVGAYVEIQGQWIAVANGGYALSDVVNIFNRESGEYCFKGD